MLKFCRTWELKSWTTAKSLIINLPVKADNVSTGWSGQCILSSHVRQLALVNNK